MHTVHGWVPVSQRLYHLMIARNVLNGGRLPDHERDFSRRVGGGQRAWSPETGFLADGSLPLFKIQRLTGLRES